MVRESKDLSRLAICCSTSSTACPFQTERGQVVTLTEVKDALFRAYLQVDNRSYSSTCQFYVSLSLLIVTAWSVCNYHEVAFPPTVWLEGGRSMRPPLSSPWHYTKQQAVSGVSPTLLRWSPTPHSSQVSRDCLEKPSMKSKTWIQLHLYGATHLARFRLNTRPSRRSSRSIRFVSHILFSKREEVSH